MDFKKKNQYDYIYRHCIYHEYLLILLLLLLLFIGYSLGFATSVFRTILTEQNVEQLGKYLVTCGMDTRLLELFPPNKREEECLSRHFEAEDMKQLVSFHQVNQKNSMKVDLLSNLKQMLNDEAKPTEVSQFFLKKNYM